MVTDLPDSAEKAWFEDNGVMREGFIMPDGRRFIFYNGKTIAYDTYKKGNNKIQFSIDSNLLLGIFCSGLGLLDICIILALLGIIIVDPGVYTLQSSFIMGMIIVLIIIGIPFMAYGVLMIKRSKN